MSAGTYGANGGVTSGTAPGGREGLYDWQRCISGITIKTAFKTQPEFSQIPICIVVISLWSFPVVIFTIWQTYSWEAKSMTPRG